MWITRHQHRTAENTRLGQKEKRGVVFGLNSGDHRACLSWRPLISKLTWLSDLEIYIIDLSFLTFHNSSLVLIYILKIWIFRKYLNFNAFVKGSQVCQACYITSNHCCEDPSPIPALQTPPPVLIFLSCLLDVNSGFLLTGKSSFSPADEVAKR